jgi:uncharacterized repeat protein (TIGR03803 family)
MKNKKLLFASLFIISILFINRTYAQHKLYGMTFLGGTNDDGVLFEYDPVTSTYTKKLDFDSASSSIGGCPGGSLMQASNNKLYGMAALGGTNGGNAGVLFEYNSDTDTYTKKFDFDSIDAQGCCPSGCIPVGSLIQALNNKLYGMTTYGGTNGYGVLFEYDITNNTYTKKLDFDSINTGAYSYGNLMQASNGKLYGMTTYGGANDDGVLFEYDITNNIFTKKLDFVENNTGSWPNGSLIQVNGKLYGMTYAGGANGVGVLFEYDPNTNTYIKKFDFDYTNTGDFPEGSLLQASNNKLYGMTTQGGTNNDGVLFEYDLGTDTYTKKLDFDSASTGKYPRGSLMQTPDGKLYGMTTQGGTNNNGTFFKYDITTNTYTKILNFDGTNGRNPQFTALIEVDTGSYIQNLFANNEIKVYPNPGKDKINVIFNSDNKQETYFEIFSLSGNKIVSYKLKQGKNILSAKNLSQGIYSYKIIANKNTIASDKLVIIK